MAELDIIKQMPHSLQAEQALLGAIIIDQSNFLKTETLRPEHFYIESHRVIYSAVKDLFVKSRSIDFITLIEAIKENSGITDFDVAKYIKTICDVAAENTKVTEYVRI
ncbi:MAG: DnaB-like helicase N-terminal domain-containing protein, partial [Eubacteriales bacterium]|nr:DnaB-like helicase N-terminal domain-containing protein [Eubacteriales bacterium]